MKTIKAPFRISGGVHPPYRKDRTAALPVRDLPVPQTLRLLMAQHLGAPAKPLVKKGDVVRRGQPVGGAAGFVSSPVHAPTSGTVKAVVEVYGPSGAMTTAVDLVPDGADQWVEGVAGCPDWEAAEPKALADRVAAAGVVGMGGAGFPTHVKLSPPPDKPIDTLILNGAECEPCLTADHRLMVEQAAAVWTGARIVRRILGAKSVFVAIEDNKPDAIAAMEQAMRGADDGAALVVLPTAYPHGAEKQQIYAVTGREVPSGGLPMDVGCVVENVGTALAIRDAVVDGRPLTERITTVTGLPVKDPANLRARIGASFADLIAACGGTTGPVGKIVAGGPMMGLAQAGTDAVTTKTTSGLLLLPPQPGRQYVSLPCIGCGRCVAACPMRLLPCDLSQMLEAERYDAAESADVMDCIECGCCAWECPARRPLVQHMKRGKAYVAAKRRQAQAQKKT